MFSYNVFKGFVYEKIKDYMSPEYSEAEIEFDVIRKVNVSRECLKITPNILDDKIIKASPVIYLDSMYQDYLESGDIRKVLLSAAKSYEKAVLNSKQIGEAAVLSRETIEENIIFQLINTEQNRELLKNIPHRAFEDLSIVYRWVMQSETEDTEMGHALIDNNMLQRLFKSEGFTEQNLFELAYKNTKRIMPVLVTDIDSMILNITDGMVTPEENDCSACMWVISNEVKIFGAASVIYEDVLHDIADRLNSDLYILPSSIHEVIAVPSDIASLQQFEKLVKDTNNYCVEPEERLSNSVYHYDRNLRKLKLATGGDSKSLNNFDDISEKCKSSRRI